MDPVAQVSDELSTGQQGRATLGRDHHAFTAKLDK
jgi:hypothetical protein